MTPTKNVLRVYNGGIYFHGIIVPRSKKKRIRKKWVKRHSFPMAVFCTELLVPFTQFNNMCFTSTPTSTCNLVRTGKPVIRSTGNAKQDYIMSNWIYMPKL